MNGILDKSRKSIVITAVAVVLGGAGVAMAFSGALSGSGDEKPSVTTVSTAVGETTPAGTAADLVGANGSSSATGDATTPSASTPGQPPAGRIGSAGSGDDDDDDHDDHDDDHDGDHDDDDDHRDDDDHHDDDHDDDDHDDHGDDGDDD